MRELKVYGYNYCGTHRKIVATRTKKRAIELLGITRHDAKDFMCETGNVKELEIAKSKPGVIFIKSYLGKDDKYVEDKSTNQ